MQDESYNGYSNYETWCCALWLSSDECSQYEARKTANDPCLSDVSKDEIFKRMVETRRPDADDKASMYTDLLSNAISRINWTEITECFKDE